MMQLGSVILKVDSLCVADSMWYVYEDEALSILPPLSSYPALLFTLSSYFALISPSVTLAL